MALLRNKPPKSSMLHRLRARFPRGFPFPPQPLAVGSSREAFRRMYPHLHCGGWVEMEYTSEGKRIIAAFQEWCGSLAYLSACSHAGALRFNLDGEVDGEVSHAESEWAARQYLEIERGLRKLPG